MSLTLGGRAFIVDLDRMTFQQAHYLMGHIRIEGLDEVWPVDGESDEAYTLRVRSGIIRAGNIPQVLAGYLVPEGMTWTPAGARETAAHLAGLVDEEDHARVLDLAQQVAPDFFVRALDWFAISHLSSSGSQPLKPSPTLAH